MHFHRHDVDACVDSHDDWPDWALTILATLDRRELQLMSQIQDSIDALAAQLSAAADSAEAKLADVEAQLAAAQSAEPAVDLSALQAAVAKVAALVPAPAPVDAPVEQPADPAPAADTPVDPAPADTQPVDSPAVVNGIPSVPLA